MQPERGHKMSSEKSAWVISARAGKAPKSRVHPIHMHTHMEPYTLTRQELKKWNSHAGRG